MSNTRRATGARTSRSRTKKAEPAAHLDALLGAGARPERVVPICLRGDLQAEWDRLKQQFDAGPGPDDQAMLSERAARRKIAEQMAEVEDEMRAGTIHFRLRALPRRRTPSMPPEQVVWRELVEQHPPRKDSKGKVDPRDAGPGLNMSTFFEALVRVSVVEPVLSEQQWESLNEQLTDAQFERLYMAAWHLNKDDVDVPFSRAASMIRRLGTESRRQSGSASPSNASTAGNPEPSPPTSTTTTDS